MMKMMRSGKRRMIMKTIKLKIMTLIKEFLFGRRTNAVCQIKLGFKSTYPDNQPDQWSWAKEYRVGMLADRKITYLN